MSQPRYGLYIPNYGPLAEPATIVKLAKMAEEKGWEGLFLWDHIPVDSSMNAYDPWLLLSLVATNTEKLRIGTTVTPLARRRVQKLAKEVVTLDHISNGRFTLGIGLGNEKEFSAYGEEFKPRKVSKRLDESVEVLRLLWSGEEVDYNGKQVKVKAMHHPTPVQEQIPIWVGGVWPNKAPFRRAARHQGVFPLKAGDGYGMTPQDYKEILSYIEKHGGDLTNYDVVMTVYSQGDQEKDKWMSGFNEAGVNWFVDCLDPWRGDAEYLINRIKKGPSRSSTHI